MNTKGIKFLAVLAVLAMAFAAFAVIANDEGSDAAEAESAVLTDAATGDLDDDANLYFIDSSDSVTLTMTAVNKTVNIFMIHAENGTGKITLNTGAVDSSDLDVNVYMAKNVKDTNNKVKYEDTKVVSFVGADTASLVIDIKVTSDKITLTGDGTDDLFPITPYITTATANVYDAVYGGDVSLPVGGTFTIPALNAYTGKIIGATATTATNEAKFVIPDTNADELVFTNPAGVLTLTPGAGAIGVTTFEMVRGSLTISTNPLDAVTNLNAVSTVGDNDGNAKAGVYYGPVATPGVNVTIYGTLSDLDLTMAAYSVTLNAAKVSGKITATLGALQIRTDADNGASAAITNTTLTAKVTVGELQIVSGVLTATAGGDLTAATKTLTIQQAATLKLTSGDSIDNTGILNVYGIVTTTGAANGTLATAGVTNVYPSGYLSATVAAAAAQTINDLATGAQKSEGTIEADQTVNDLTLTGAGLTIAKGVTLTVNGTLALDKKTLTVNGKLVIASTGSIVASVTDETIGKVVIAKTGSVELNGKVGNAAPVEFDIGATSKVFAQGISGLQLGQTGTEPKATISGTVTKANLSAPVISQIVGTEVFVKGELTISNGVTLTNTDGTVGGSERLTVMDNAILTINAGAKLISVGDTNNSDMRIFNGSTLVMKGFFKGKIYAETGVGIKADGSNFKPTGGGPDVAVYENYINSANNDISTSAFTIKIFRVSYSNASGDVLYDQRASISGTLGLSTGDALKPMTILGTFFVLADDTVTMTTKAYTTGGTLVVLGKVIHPEAEYDPAVSTLVGTAYSKTVADVTTKYVTTFEDAFADIANAVNKTIVLNGTATAYGDDVASYSAPEAIVVENGWTIESNANAMLKVGKDSIVTVKSGATVNASIFKSLSGKLIVEQGAACVPTVALYQVVSTDASNTKTYAGLAVILAEAQDGDKIVLTGNANMTSSSITVASGVTLTISAEMTARNMTIAEGGKVIVSDSGMLKLNGIATKNFNLKVAGELDGTEAATFSVTGAYGTIESTGKLVYTPAQRAVLFVDGVKVVGAEYDITTPVVAKILTSAEKAIASGSNVTISSKYVSTEEVTITAGKTLTIEGATTEVTLGKINAQGATIVSDGKLTATIVGVAGVDGAEDVEIQVDGFTGSINDLETTNTKAEKVSTFQNNAAITAGSIMIMKGTFTMANDIAGNNTQTFVVGEEGKLVVSGGAISGYESVVFAGDVVSDTGVAITITAVPTEIYGTVVAKNAFNANEAVSIVGSLTVGANSAVGAAGKDVIILGSLTIPEDYTFTVTGDAIIGNLLLGADTGIDGKITLAAGAYAFSYVDAEDNFAVNAKETVVSISGIPYAYVYTTDNTATIANLLNNKAIKFEVIGLDLSEIRTITAGNTNWKDIDGDKIAANTKLYNITLMDYAAEIAQVTIKTSWATGTSLYVDGIRMADTEYRLDVGAHTVAFKVDPGYKGTDMKVTYDGVAVTSEFIVYVGDDGAILSGTGNIVVDPGESPEPTPEEKSDWTITTILLVVLVILIAILVVVLILRLNRS